MRGIINKIIGIWPYLVFAFAMILVFIFLLFPERLLLSFISGKFSASLPGYGLSADKASLTLPPGLKIVRPVISMKTGESVGVDYIYIRPSLLTIAGLSKSFHADLRGFGGNADMDVDFKDFQNIKKAEVELKKIDISKLPKSAFKGYEVKGILDAAAEIKQGEKGYDGSLFASLSQASIDLPFLSGIDLSNAKADLDCSIKSNAADIKKCVFSAGEFSGDVKGKVMVVFPVNRSTINLTVNVNRKEGGSVSGSMLDSFFKAGTNKRIVLTGTIDNPKYSLN